MLKNFRTYQLALNFYKEGRRLKLTGAIADQFDRASLSIVLNLAEGSSKPHKKDRLKFYHIALASLRESQAALDIIENPSLQNQADHLGACLWKLIKKPGI